MTWPMAGTFALGMGTRAGFLPPSGHEFVPPGHPAHVIRNKVREALDLPAVPATSTPDRGIPPDHPGMMVALLLYGYSCRI